MLFYRAALPLSSRTLTYASGIIRRHRAATGSRWRKLNPGKQALLVLVYLRKGETFAELAAGFGVGTTTAWRYVNEIVALLAARAPKLRTAVRDAKKAGCAYVVLDGTLIPVDRVAADRPFYSGKHRKHGMNLQVIASPDGDILWVSGALPGAVHDLTAARIWGIVRDLAACGLIVLGDKSLLIKDAGRGTGGNRIELVTVRRVAAAHEGTPGNGEVTSHLQRQGSSCLFTLPRPGTPARAARRRAAGAATASRGTRRT